MVNYLIKSPVIAAILAIVLTSNVNAKAELIEGTFRGDDRTTLTDCPIQAFNMSKTDSWQVSNTTTGSHSFEGTGNTWYGSFTIKGKRSRNKLFGAISGTNNWGANWSGDFNAQLRDDKLFAKVKGKIPEWECNFTSDINASRQ